MKLLIIGAGGLGQVAKDIAETMKCFSVISFVDDNSPLAIGKTEELEQLRMKYDAAFVAIGNNSVRRDLQLRCKKLGYQMVSIVSEDSYISKSSTIGEGVLVQPKAAINTNARIGDGVIISIGALIDHDTEVGEFSHINSGAIIKAGASVEAFVRIDAGEVVKGFY